VYSSLRERSRLLRLMRRVVSDPELLVTRCACCRRYACDGVRVRDRRKTEVSAPEDRALLDAQHLSRCFADVRDRGSSG
jgi:hypothetical protein